LHDYRTAAHAVSFVDNVHVVDGAKFAARLLDTTRDVVVGHVVGFCLLDDVVQLAVTCGVATTCLYRNGYFTTDFGKDFATCGVALSFFVFDIVPFTMSGHSLPPNFGLNVFVFVVSLLSPS